MLKENVVDELAELASREHPAAVVAVSSVGAFPNLEDPNVGMNSAVM